MGLSVWLVVGAAHAQTAPTPTQPPTGPTPSPVPPPDADALIAQGVTLRTQQRDAEALALFERANAMTPSPRALAQIALAEQALNRWVAAERHLREALASASDPWIARNAPALRSALGVIDSHLGRLEVRTNVPGAELWVSAVREGTLPLTAPLRVPVGSLPIEVRAAGYQPATRTVTITTGNITTETITLTQDPQVVGPMGPSTPGSTDYNEQTRARLVLIGGVGAGVPMMLPIVGLGVRYGFFQNRFEIQGRVDLALIWNPLGAGSTTFNPHPLGPSLGVDGTFRVRPISNRSIWYAGLGIMARVGFTAPVVPPPMGATTSETLRFIPAVGLAVETGFLLGERSQWDLSFRFLFGLGALTGVVTLGYSF